MNLENTSSRDNLSYLIGSLAKSPLSLRMTVRYQGLELKQEVRVLEASRHQAFFQATDLPPCAILDKNVHLTSCIFPRAVVAQIVDRNVEKGILELADFAFTESRWMERQSERVHPKNPTYLSLHCKQKAYRVFLEDISTSGLAVLVRRNPDRNATIRSGVRVYLTGQLAPGFPLENLKGSLVYRKDVDPLLVKLGILIYPHPRQAELLHKYLAARREEILTEINQAYLKNSQAEQVPGLYN